MSIALPPSALHGSGQMAAKSVGRMVDTLDMADSREPGTDPSDSRSPTAIDRRRSSREPVVTVGMIRRLSHDDESSEQVLVTNVSLHGVGFRSTHPLPMGSRWAIEIGVGPLHLTSRLRVARCRARNDGTYDMGGEFC